MEVALLVSTNQVSLEINARKTKYVFVCQQQNTVHYTTVTTNHLKIWYGSDVWERHKQIKIAYMKILRADETQIILLTFHPAFSFPSLLSETVTIKI
jgi:hypothetical protein